MNGAPEPRMLKAVDVCKYLSISPNTLRRMVANGLLPQPKPITGKLVRWDKRMIDAYLDGKMQ